MCTGTGSMKSTGYPTSEDTFDGEYICYNLGLPVVGKEFDDFHQTSSYAPGNYFYNNTWEYCENMSGSSIGATVDTVDDYCLKKAKSKITYRLASVLDGLEPQDGTTWQSSFTGATTIIQNEYGESDPRQTGYSRSKERVRDVFGAAPGMNSQMSCGVFCGWDDKEGYTGIPGLYVAGNGIYGSQVNGAIFNVQTNHPGCCIMGNHSGAAAAGYAATIELPEQDQSQVDAIIEEIFEPTKREKGLDPNFVVEKLRNIMVDPGVHIVKSEKALTAALMQVEIIRDEMLPKLMGLTGHDLRLCLEAKHKALSAEMKLRANLFRTESRGMHYRSDYPYHDDENWLCHVGVYKDENGEVACRKIEIPDEWKGDLSEAHDKRYVLLFPGEAEALGITVEKSEEQKG
jgi:succinate dehydrogenase/fumarate reductase flavoprotein subunit